MRRPGIPVVDWIFSFIGTVLGTIIGGIIGGIAAILVAAVIGLFHLITMPFRKSRRTGRSKTHAHYAPVYAPVQNIEPTAPAEQVEAPFQGAQQGRTEPEATPYVAPQVEVEPVTYRGYLRWSGMKRRTDVEKPYTAYCVQLKEPRTKANHVLWGGGLSVALEEAHAEVGDLVVITQTGRQKISIEGRMVHKNLWSVQVEKKDGKRQQGNSGRESGEGSGNPVHAFGRSDLQCHDRDLGELERQGNR